MMIMMQSVLVLILPLVFIFIAGLALLIVFIVQKKTTGIIIGAVLTALPVLILIIGLGFLFFRKDGPTSAEIMAPTELESEWTSESSSSSAMPDEGSDSPRNSQKDE